jgi:hypothetical protein
MKIVGTFVVVGLSIGTIGVVGLLALVRHDVAVPFGGEILWDDFGFGVVSARTASELGTEEHLVHPHGVFVIVGLKVSNHAQRVDYGTSKHTAVLHDSTGNEYRVDPWAQSALGSEPGRPNRAPARLAAGESCVTELVYDVPSSASGFYLKISWGGELVDAVDAVVFGDRRIEVAMSSTR